MKTLIINEMSCNHCVQSITEKLLSTEHVRDVTCDLDRKEVRVDTDLSEILLVEILDEIGFTVDEIHD